MESFLSKLVARHTESPVPVLQPRIASRFEDPISPVANLWGNELSSQPEPTAPSAAQDNPFMHAAPTPVQHGVTPPQASSPAIAYSRREHETDFDDRLRQAEEALRRMPWKTADSIASDVAAPHLPSAPDAASALPIRPPHPRFPTDASAMPVSPARTPQIEPRATDHEAFLSKSADRLRVEPTPQPPVARRFDIEPVNSKRNPQPAPRIITAGTQAAATRAPSIPTTEDASVTAPSKTIHVSIGRIEIRNAKRPAETPKPRPTGNKPKIMTLTEYVQARERRNA